MNFSDMKIGQRLGAGIAVSAVLLSTMVWIGVSRIGQVQDSLDIVADERLPQIIAIKDIKDNIRIRATLVRNVVLLEDAADIKKEADAFGPVRENYAKLDKQLQNTIKTPDGKAALAKAEAAIAAITGPTDQVLALGIENKNH
jgi:methyl-accepting chemotaxis protein